MAQGDYKGGGSIQGTSVTNPFSVTGLSIAVNAGDLVVAYAAERTQPTFSAISDNLSNSSGSHGGMGSSFDSGNTTGRFAYYRVANAGTITSVSGAFTASASDTVLLVAVFEGPFENPPLDKNLTSGATADSASPYSSITSGVLAQANELLVSAISTTNGTFAPGGSSGAILVPPTGFTDRVENSTSNGGANSTGCSLASRVVSSTTSTAYAWTGTTTQQTGSALVSFKFASNDPTGTLAGTETGSDTASVSGTVAVSGSLSATDSGSDSASISGGPIAAGSLSATDSGNDTASIEGSVQGDEITGTLAATESGADTATISGGPVVAGSLSATEAGADTSSISGGPTASGALAATETGSDTATVSGGPAVAGALGATEAGQDTAAATGSVLASGSLSATETAGSDAATVSGSTLVAGQLGATEAGSDAASASGQVLVEAALAATETGQDTSSISGEVVEPGPSGTLSATEADGPDTATVTGSVAVAGALSATESGQDTANITGGPTASGSLAATETGEDAAAMSGGPTVAGAMAATEAGQDSAAISGPGALEEVTGTLAGVETGSDTAAITEAEPEPERRGGPALPYYDRYSRISAYLERRRQRKTRKRTLEEVLAELHEEAGHGTAGVKPRTQAPHETVSRDPTDARRTHSSAGDEERDRALERRIVSSPRSLRPLQPSARDIAAALQPGFRKIRQAEAERVANDIIAEDAKRRRRRAAAMLLLH